MLTERDRAARSNIYHPLLEQLMVFFGVEVAVVEHFLESLGNLCLGMNHLATCHGAAIFPERMHCLAGYQVGTVELPE